MPTPGGPDDLYRTVEWFTSAGGTERSSAAYRVLFAIRWKLGALLGWDEPGTGIGTRVRTLLDRLPDDLRDGTRGPDPTTVPFTSVYETDTEWVAETANRTVHAAMHIGWVPDDSGIGYHGQMAVLVKPDGLFGRVYMTMIVPFRYLLVYPALLRSIGRGWVRQPESPPA